MKKSTFLLLVLIHFLGNSSCVFTKELDYKKPSYTRPATNSIYPKSDEGNIRSIPGKGLQIKINDKWKHIGPYFINQMRQGQYFLFLRSQLILPEMIQNEEAIFKQLNNNLNQQKLQHHE
jgi:hypothetical protein